MKAVNGIAFTDKEYQMAALYGLNNPGPAPQSPIIGGVNVYEIYKGMLNKSFNNIKSKYEFIARYYVETITYTLKQYDNNKFGDDYYRALSWNGLKGTDVYNNLTDAEKNDIETKKAALLANRNKNNCDD